MKQPYYDLERVKELVASGKIWLTKKRAADMFETLSAAIFFAKRVTNLLSVENFSKTVELHEGKADVYGIEIDNAGWYVKLYIDEAEPDVTFVSLHLLERDLLTNKGKVKP